MLAAQYGIRRDSSSFIFPNLLEYAEVGGDEARHWCGGYVVSNSETGAASNKHGEVGS